MHSVKGLPLAIFLFTCDLTAQGFAIGNGLTDPAIQYGAYADFALDMGIVTQSEHDRINKVLPLCEVAIKLCGTIHPLVLMLQRFTCFWIAVSLWLFLKLFDLVDK